jgi:CubicO group peptidase (beta-lactamase class C family)
MKKSVKKVICMAFAFATLLSSVTSVQASANSESKRLPSCVAYEEIGTSIDSFVRENQGTMAAMSVSVFDENQTIYENNYGYLNQGTKLLNDKNAVFEWGSITKALVWVSVMQQVERGNIDLNADIRNYLPNNFFKKLKYDEPITMLNLMNHNAGWQEVATDLFVDDKSDMMDLGKQLQYMEPEQLWKPGETQAYSNWGSALAGYIIECVTGQSFTEYVHENIFSPLDMQQTAISADMSDNEWVLNKRMEENCYSAENKSLGTCFYYNTIYPAGGAIGTIEDLTKFSKALYGKNNGKSLLFENNKSQEEFLSASLVMGDQVTDRNYHGLWPYQLGVLVHFHNGSTVGSSSFMAFDLKSGVGVVVLTNQSEESKFVSELPTLVFGENTIVGNKDENGPSGYYMNARTCKKGFSKLYSLLCITHISKNDQSLENLENGLYLMKQGKAGVFVYQQITQDGKETLQTVSEDCHKVSKWYYYGEIASLVLFLIAVLYSVVTIMIEIISKILRKKKDCFGYIVGMDSTIIGSAVLVMILVSKLFGDIVLYREIQWILVAFAIITCFIIGCLMWLLCHFRKLSCTRRRKLRLLCCTIAGVIVMFNILYWNLFMFW